jgi:hypothetical protein
VGRAIAARSRVGAAGLGAWIGAQSLVLGMVLADPAHWREPGLLVFSAGVGVIFGAAAGLLFRARATAWDNRAKKTKRAF